MPLLGRSPGLCLAYGVARCIHDGDEQYARWLRLSLHAEEVPGAWHVGHCSPQWPLLKQHLEASVEEREERLFTNRSNQPGDDMKDEVRTDDNRHAWRLWPTAWNRFLRLRQPGPPTEVS